jgi:hypothetical protein
MRGILVSTLMLLLVGLVPVSVAAQDTAVKPDLSENAALQYWQAFSQMPALNEDQEKLLAEWQTVPLDDPEVQKLIAGSQTSLMYLRRAAKLRRCDWGLDYKDGIAMLLPHLAKGRDLARFAALNARQHFEHGNRRAARQDASAIMVLARHIGSEPFMICVLVRLGIEGLVVDLVAPYVPQLGASHSQSVELFQNLPSAPTVAGTIAPERQIFLEYAARKIREEEQRQAGEGLRLWRNLLGGSEVPESVKDVASAEEAARRIEMVLPVYDELARLVALPPDEFDAQYPAFKAKTRAEQPLAGLLLPSVDQLLAKERRNDARLAMLLAAVAVADGGRDKLREIKDPFGTGPFDYRDLDQGFELKSKLVFEGQPVTLTVGRPAGR